MRQAVRDGTPAEPLVEHRRGFRLVHAHHHRLRTTTPFRRLAVARLHARCSGPTYRDRSWSSWPRSQGSPGAISLPHRAQTTNPAATCGAHRFRRR